MNQEYISSADKLSSDGVFDTQWQAFSPRTSQQRMAAIIDESIVKQQTVVVEAPSGSGKTLGYLVPVLSQPKRAVISTASRYLQQQLYKVDIPLAQKILGSNRSVTLLQGRRHYLCPQQLDKNLRVDRGLEERLQRQLVQILQRFRETGMGEVAKLVPNLDRSIAMLVTSSTEDCLGKHCPKYSVCPLYKVRRKAENADVVIVNHSLLFTDQMNRQERLGELLPSADVVVVDEAHRISDYAQTIIGQRLTSKKLTSFVTDMKSAINRLAPEQLPLKASLQNLTQGIDTVSNNLSKMHVYKQEDYRALIKQLVARFIGLQSHLRQLQERDHALVELSMRIQLLIIKLRSVNHDNGLSWIQSVSNGFIIQSIPLRMSVLLKELFSEVGGSWIFTSATLSIGNNSEKFLASLGLDAPSFYRLDSEIDHRLQARLYTPQLSLEPDHPNYNNDLMDNALPLLTSIKGRVLFLFSSYQALTVAAQYLLGYDAGPIFVQDADSRRNRDDNYRLVESFRQSARGVLLGTGSFWEGLDLSGVSLQAVIVDKLPFAVPSDPLVQQRCQELADHGVDSFEHLLLPQAIMRLQQGCGRLLRSVTDRGVIMLADPRIHSREYGPLFISSLPPMEQVYSLSDLQPFIREMADSKLGEREFP